MTLSLLSKTALVAAFLLGLSSSSLAKGYIARSSTKFGVGFVNAATCWLEVPLRVCAKYRESRNPLYGICLAPSLGCLEGGTLTLGRLAGGVADVATFPVPWPQADFEPILEPIWKGEQPEEGPGGLP